MVVIQTPPTDQRKNALLNETLFTSGWRKPGYNGAPLLPASVLVVLSSSLCTPSLELMRGMIQQTRLLEGERKSRARKAPLNHVHSRPRTVASTGSALPGVHLPRVRHAALAVRGLDAQLAADDELGESTKKKQKGQTGGNDERGDSSCELPAE